LTLNEYSAVVISSFHMSAAALQFNPHAHPSVLGYGAFRVWFGIVMSELLLVRMRLMGRRVNSLRTGMTSMRCS